MYQSLLRQIHRLSVSEFTSGKISVERLGLLKGFSFRFVLGDNRWLTLFFPAAGNYNGTSLNNRGSNGNYWSSTWISATNARNLNFNSSGVNPQNNNNRRNGFSVRAVQHLSEAAIILDIFIRIVWLTD